MFIITLKIELINFCSEFLKGSDHTYYTYFTLCSVDYLELQGHCF